MFIVGVDIVFFSMARYGVHGCPQTRIRPLAIEERITSTANWTREREQERVQRGKKSHTVLFALKLHNHKSREMNIIQMSSDEILMYVMSYIRSECVFFLYVFLLIHRLFVCDRVRSRFECVARHSQWKWTWKKWRKKMRWMCCECISRPLCYISIFTWIDMSSIKAARYY